MEAQKNESQDNSFNSAHFGSPSLHSQKNEIPLENSHEILIQLAKSNDTTKKLAVVFSGMVSKIKQLEEDNNKLKMENDELLVLY